MASVKQAPFRSYSMRRLEADTHERLDYLAYLLHRTKEDVVRECLLLGIDEMEEVNGVGRKRKRG